MTSKVPDEQKVLGKVGVRVDYSDKGGITGIFVPFTPKEWFDIASQNGRHYIGGCCGTASAMQDIVCSMFRDGGELDSGTLLRLGDYAKSHPDGFEDWADKIKPTTLRRRIQDWKKLDPWNKLGVIYRVTYDKLADSDWHGTRPSIHSRPKPESSINHLYNGLRVLNYSDLFDRMDRGNEPPEFGPQRHANTLVLIARIMPDARSLVDVLKAKFAEFEGHTITHETRPDEPLENGLGLCIYAEKPHADEMVERWTKDGPELEGKLRVRPVRITMESGITFLDTPASGS